MKLRPWGVHVLGDVYHPDVTVGLPNGRVVAAVGEPYTAGSLRAAWWVFTGRAYAFLWPKAGDLEDIFQARKPVLDRNPPRPFEPRHD